VNVSPVEDKGMAKSPEEMRRQMIDHLPEKTGKGLAE
jgi:hypothetical protein